MPRSTYRISAYRTRWRAGAAASAVTPHARRPPAELGNPAGDALDVVGLRPLMDLTAGRPEVVIGLVDGPVQLGHPELAEAAAAGDRSSQVPHCTAGPSLACRHGTLVAGILVARRGSPAPAVCPQCTLLIRPVFAETTQGFMPTAAHGELAEAIHDSVKGGAKLVNVSASLSNALAGDDGLTRVLDFAMLRGAIIVAAAGNEATIGGSELTRHPAVIPVVACDGSGSPLPYSGLSPSIGRRGLCAPGERVVSTSADGGFAPISGTSAAAPFVTGTLALLWSLFPSAGASELRSLVAQARTGRAALVPPLLNAISLYGRMARSR